MESINREHPEYTTNKAMWRKYADLYAGGEQFRASAESYLIRRNKEPGTVYGERLGRVFYENYIGSIIDWYAATLLRREPLVLYDGNDAAAKGFFSHFTEDCDRNGTNFAEFFRQQFVRALVYGRSYMVVDFPRLPEKPKTRAEEDALGRSRAFLTDYTPQDVINWNRRADGMLDWVVLRRDSLQQSKVTDAEWRKETQWIYYDREIYRMYRRESGSGPIRQADEGRHGLASIGKVPLFTVQVSDGLWLMNKAALLQLEHFNKSNALAWALTMGLFAMPVIYSDAEWKQVVGESYYVQLGQNDRFGWSEPEGHVYQIAADNLVRLKEEIYRVCYLMTQSGGHQAANVAQSGISKQRDFSITQEILRAYGDSLKESMKQVLRAIVAARQDGLTIDVSGLDEFDIGDFGGDLDDAGKLLALGIESPTLKKQLFKKLAFKYFCDARQDIKNRIAEEIEKA